MLASRFSLLLPAKANNFILLLSYIGLIAVGTHGRLDVRFSLEDFYKGRGSSSTTA